MAGGLCSLATVAAIVVTMAVPALSVDPCVDDSTLPNEGLRYEYFKVGSSEEASQDTYIKEGWYRSCEPMLDHPPASIYHCGTKFPIWLPGDPPVSSTPVTMEACQRDLFNNCTKRYAIQAAKCSDGCYSYNLGRTGSSSGYCFGVGVEGDRPQYKPPKPEVQVDLKRTKILGYNVSSTRFTCVFKESTSTDLLYMVHWYRNGRMHYNTPVAENHTIGSLHLTEDVFNKTFKLGIDLACSVTAFAVENGPPGPRSSLSDNLFAGIRILTPNLLFSAADESGANITLQPTIPIGCQNANERCFIRLMSFTELPDVKEECQRLAFDGEEWTDGACGAKIYSNSWGSPFNITVVSNEGQVNTQESYQVLLMTDETTENVIWQNYTLDPVSVTVTIGAAGTATNTKCSIKSDPHVQTMDGRQYDYQNTAAIKTVYWHPTLNTEVQVRSRSCHGTGIYCPCGVAARAGLDVYVWDICDGTHIMGYQYCAVDRRALTVKAKNNDDIKITFTYGTYVHVTTRKLYGSTFLEVFIYPTARDRHEVRGMCGTYDDNPNNEFHLRDGTVMPSSYHSKYPHGYESKPKKFTDEWDVLPENDLFNLTTFDENKLVSYKKKICVCEKVGDDDDLVGGDLQGTIPCTPNGAATCQQGRLLEAHHCVFIDTTRRRRSAKERKRSAKETQNIRPRVPRVAVRNRITSSSSHRKRKAIGDSWTAQSSLEYCTASINATDIYQLCSQLESLDLSDNFDVCVIDILLTNTTDWTSFAINSLATECYETLLRNVTLVREAATGNNPVLINIKQAFCPDLECSHQGACVNGACVCDPGFAGDDCSVDLSLPPSMGGLLDGGLCDKLVSNCNETFVFGGAYVNSEVLLVKIQPFEVDKSGSRTYTSVSIVTPSFETYLELKITFVTSTTSRRRRRSTVTSDDVFISGYAISVTNDGQQYSETADFYVYDSECQVVQEINGTVNFTLQSGYCYVANQCVLDGEINTGDSCYFCNETAATMQWSLNSSRTGCVPPSQHGEGESSYTAVIVGVTIGGLVLFAGVIVVLVFVFKKTQSSRAKVDASTRNYDSVQDHEATQTAPASSQLLRSNTTITTSGLVFDIAEGSNDGQFENLGSMLNARPAFQPKSLHADQSS